MVQSFNLNLGSEEYAWNEKDNTKQRYIAKQTRIRQAERDDWNERTRIHHHYQRVDMNLRKKCKKIFTKYV